MQQFKVGDWITLLDKGIYQIKVVSKDSTKVFLGTKESPQSDNWWNITQCKLWQPKDGEWVVVFDKDDKNFFGVVKYNEEVKEALKDPLSGYTTIEPFIGEFPSYLKDNK